jgi:hypothetical protein
VLLPHIKDAEWDVVAQLALQIIDRQAEGAADRIFSLLLDATSESRRRTAMRLRSFMARSLRVVVPRSEIVRSFLVSLIPASTSPSPFLLVNALSERMSG